MRKQVTVHICTTPTPSESGLNHALEQTEQALTQRRYQHASVCVSTASTSKGEQSLILWARKHVMDLNLQLICGKPGGGEIFTKVMPVPRVGVGGTHEQV